MTGNIRFYGKMISVKCACSDYIIRSNISVNDIRLTCILSVIVFCVPLQTRGDFLDLMLTLLLNPAMPMNSRDTVDWLKWLMAGGKTPDEFFSIGEYRCVCVCVWS